MAKVPAQKVATKARPAIQRNVSGVAPGKASQRVQTRLIVPYGPPKCGKTTACANIEGAKWIVSDSNCIPTLDAMDRLPAGEDVYEISSLEEARQLVEAWIAAARDGKFSLPAVIIDSLTQLSDWEQQDVARSTGQTFMGQNAKNNGWQQFNASFGAFIDALAELSRYVNLVVICHAKEKADASRGDWGGLNLPPQMALKLGRVANWVLFHTATSRPAAEGEQNTPFVTVLDAPDGKRAIERVIHTQNLGMWIAGANARSLGPEEPPDLAELMKKEGLI